MILAVACVLQRDKCMVCCPGYFALVETSMIVIVLCNTVSQKFVFSQGQRLLPVPGLYPVCGLYEEQDVTLGSTY